MNKLYEGYSGLSPEKQSDLLARVGFNGCHDMVGLFDRACSMLQEFSTDMEEGEYFVTGTVKSVSEDGYRDYLQIDYGSADIDKVPEEGKYATVYYHDEAYGDTTNVDESIVPHRPRQMVRLAFRVAQIPFFGQNHVLTSKAPHASSLPPHMPLDMVERVPSALT